MGSSTEQLSQRTPRASGQNKARGSLLCHKQIYDEAEVYELQLCTPCFNFLQWWGLPIFINI